MTLTHWLVSWVGTGESQNHSENCEMGLPGWSRARCQRVPQLLRAPQEHIRVQVLHTRQRGPFPRKTGCWWRVRQPCCPPWARHCQGRHQKEIFTTNHIYPRKDFKKSSLLHSPEPEHRSEVWMFCALQKSFINGMRYIGLCWSWLLWEWAAGLESLAWSPWEWEEHSSLRAS